jgi:hypothetical protein
VQQKDMMKMSSARKNGSAAGRSTLSITVPHVIALFKSLNLQQLDFYAAGSLQQWSVMCFSCCACMLPHVRLSLLDISKTLSVGLHSESGPLFLVVDMSRGSCLEISLEAYVGRIGSGKPVMFGKGIWFTG